MASEGRNGGVYARKNSRRSSWKFYSKYFHITKIMSLPENLPFRKEMLAYAWKLLRAEITLRSTELLERNLRFTKNWTKIDVTQLWWSEFSKLKLKGSVRKSLRTDMYSRLSPGDKKAYRLWCYGENLLQLYSRPAFRQIQKRLFEYGIDVSRQCPRDQRVLVPLQELLDPSRLRGSYPQFAKGTALFYKPLRPVL
jgi:hypothetical protein